MQVWGKRCPESTRKLHALSTRHVQCASSSGSFRGMAFPNNPVIDGVQPGRLSAAWKRPPQSRLCWHPISDLQPPEPTDFPGDSDFVHTVHEPPLTTKDILKRQPSPAPVSLHQRSPQRAELCDLLANLREDVSRQSGTGGPNAPCRAGKTAQCGAEGTAVADTSLTGAWGHSLYNLAAPSVQTHMTWLFWSWIGLLRPPSAQRSRPALRRACGRLRSTCTPGSAASASCWRTAAWEV